MRLTRQKMVHWGPFFAIFISSYFDAAHKDIAVAESNRTPAWDLFAKKGSMDTCMHRCYSQKEILDLWNFLLTSETVEKVATSDQNFLALIQLWWKLAKIKTDHYIFPLPASQNIGWWWYKKKGIWGCGYTLGHVWIVVNQVKLANLMKFVIVVVVIQSAFCNCVSGKIVTVTVAKKQTYLYIGEFNTIRKHKTYCYC